MIQESIKDKEIPTIIQMDTISSTIDYIKKGILKGGECIYISSHPYCIQIDENDINLTKKQLRKRLNTLLFKVNGLD